MFFYYNVPLVYKPIIFEGLDVADWRDIIAEKFKTLSQRGSKKDFYDLFCVLYTNRLTVEEAIYIFKKKFEHSGLNFYHVLRSLSYFDFSWEEVRSFFIRNLKEFEKYFSS